jgi:hypothetical protein
MGREFFDYDPLTGITEYYEETSDGKFHIHTCQTFPRTWMSACGSETKAHG